MPANYCVNGLDKRRLGFVKNNFSSSKEEFDLNRKAERDNKDKFKEEKKDDFRNKNLYLDKIPSIKLDKQESKISQYSDILKFAKAESNVSQHSYHSHSSHIYERENKKDDTSFFKGSSQSQKNEFHDGNKNNKNERKFSDKDDKSVKVIDNRYKNRPLNNNRSINKNDRKQYDHNSERNYKKEGGENIERIKDNHQRYNKDKINMNPRENKNFRVADNKDYYFSKDRGIPKREQKPVNSSEYASEVGLLLILDSKRLLD